jgi:hypothetical protein
VYQHQSHQWVRRSSVHFYLASQRG